MSNYPLRFFGSGQVVDAQGRTVNIRSRKQLGLLTYLATEHQTPHRRETLLALFWPNENANDAQNNLRVTLSRLRELAGKVGDGSHDDLLLADRVTVQLHPAWVEQSDVNHFNHLLVKTQLHTHRTRSQCAACQNDLRAATELYQNDFLTGFGLEDCAAFEEWLFLQRERLHLLVLEAYADLASYAESSGALPAARSFAQRQLEIDPLREPAYRQLIRIHVQLGDRSAALATFETCRTRLLEELGLDPEPETLSLHMQIVTGELGTQSAAPHTGLAPATMLSNLPHQLTPFIGRTTELEQLQVRLNHPDYRLITIVGAGGIGKSRLAQQAAAQQLYTFADGVYFVPLAQIQQHESIPTAIVNALGFTLTANHSTPAEQLREIVRHKHLLLVLDNFEHLLDGVELLVDLLQQASRVVLLVTSRERLNVQAEDLFELHGLPTPATVQDDSADDSAAVRLFVDRAQRIDKRFKLSGEQLPHIVAICQRVEGFPLAIELAATWVSELTCQEIEEELRGGLHRLEVTLRDIAPHHRSLRAVFDSSWRLLSELERKTVAQLAYFRGGFMLESARAIAEASPLLISALRNKSLLRIAGSRRYDMHALVQQFSAAVLTANPAWGAQVRAAHCDYFLRLLEEKAVALDTREAGAAHAVIAADWENILLAWQTATEQHLFAPLSAALEGLVRVCDLRYQLETADQLLNATLAALRKHQPFASNQSISAQSIEERVTLELQCRLLTALGYVAECRGNYQATLEPLQTALAIANQLGDQALLIDIYRIQAKAIELVPDNQQGIALSEKAFAMAQAAGMELLAGICLEQIGYNAFCLGDYERAKESYQRMLEVHTRTGRLELQARLAISILGQIARDQGQYESCLHYSQQFLERSDAVGDRYNSGHAYSYLADAWAQLGDYSQAILSADESLARAKLMGDAILQRSALHGKAFALRQMGKEYEALGCATDAMTLARTSGLPRAMAATQFELAECQMMLAQSQDDWEEAAANLHAAAKAFYALGENVSTSEVEIALADLAYRQGKFEVAYRQLEALLPFLPRENVNGWNEPIRAYLLAVQILRTAGIPTAEEILSQGLQLLGTLAHQISDPALRRTFLSVIPAHRQLRALQDILSDPSS